MLQSLFTNTINEYIDNKELLNIYWTEIKKQHTSKNRHYHNLTHLSNLYIELAPIKNDILNWTAVLFSIFYHDIVYDVKKQNNEKESADLAVKRLSKTKLPKELILLCKSHILATKSHEVSACNDTNLFTDADLSILGKKPEQYQQYCYQIRQEYSIYPNFLYKKGRKKVIEHFLNLERIYKTEYFFVKYEETAQKNLQKELSLL